MRLKFWGTRGSIPAPLRPDQVQQKILLALQKAGEQKIDLTDERDLQNFSNELTDKLVGSTVGGNTTCITIELDSELMIFDAGSGIRELGETLMSPDNELAQKFRFYEGKGHASIFFTHTHWDHIQGLPFFKPLHVPGNAFTIYHIHDHVPATLAKQMEQQFFPLPFELINSTLTFKQLDEEEQLTIGNASITSTELKHPGQAYAYRVAADNAIAVIATDAEYKNLDYASTAKYCSFYANADALIFDAMFSVRESFVKEDWGHSSALIGADLARDASVKNIYLFHHDPISTDAEIQEILQQTKEYLSHDKGGVVPDVHIGREGLELVLENPIFMSDFYIKDQVEKDVILLSLSGRFGAHAIDQFRKYLSQALQSHKADKVILKMEALNDLTMAGIRALVDTRRTVVSLALVGLPDNVYRVLELAGTTDFFAIYQDVDEALVAMNNHHSNNNNKGS